MIFHHHNVHLKDYMIFSSVVTIKDIAKYAGVAQGTVSNVLNGKGNVSSQKIKLVEEAARKLGYRANEGAKLLRRGNSKTIGLVLPDIRFKQYMTFKMSFEKRIEDLGYTVKTYYTKENPSTERKIIQQMASDIVAATVSFTSLQSAAAYTDAGIGMEKPLRPYTRRTLLTAFTPVHGIKTATCTFGIWR